MKRRRFIKSAIGFWAGISISKELIQPSTGLSGDWKIYNEYDQGSNVKHNPHYQEIFFGNFQNYPDSIGMIGTPRFSENEDGSIHEWPAK